MIFNNKELWVITLNNTKDRTKYTTDLLEENNFKYKLFIFSRNEIPWKGCLDSHIFLYREALNNNLDYIIVVEDNICLSKKYDVNEYNQLEKIVKNKKNWDVMIIGGFITPISQCTPTEYLKLFKTTDVHGTSAYIISKRGYTKALNDYDLKKINKPIDVYLSSLNQYIYNPLIFHHRIIPSTINSYLDTIRKFWFKPKVYEWVEFLYFNGKLRLCLYTCLLVLLFLIKLFNSFTLKKG
jgi:GR25 family glycosyltransferase involved in LPS biosynthesis